jgi:hypothetical protein
LTVQLGKIFMFKNLIVGYIMKSSRLMVREALNQQPSVTSVTAELTDPGGSFDFRLPYSCKYSESSDNNYLYGKYEYGKDYCLFGRRPGN